MSNCRDRIYHPMQGYVSVTSPLTEGTSSLIHEAYPYLCELFLQRRLLAPKKRALIINRDWNVAVDWRLWGSNLKSTMSAHSHPLAAAYIQPHPSPTRDSDPRRREKESMPRPRRKSGSLGADLRGDTGASALSTLEPTPTFLTPPISPALSPVSQLSCILNAECAKLTLLSQRNSQSKISRPRSKRRKARSYFRRWKDFSFRHTWVNPLVLTLAILSAYAVNPTTSNPLHSAIFLSYPLPPDHPHIPAHGRTDPNPPIYYG